MTCPKVRPQQGQGWLRARAPSLPCGPLLFWMLWVKEEAVPAGPDQAASSFPKLLLPRQPKGWPFSSKGKKGGQKHKVTSGLTGTVSVWPDHPTRR